MLSDDDMRERMEHGWRAGRPETVCGNGSTLANTANVRKWLPSLIKHLNIRSICDAGAGDQWWVANMVWDVSYSAFDLIPRNGHVRKLDITREALPKCDAILCRMVLNHLDTPRIQLALDLFRQSATYLIATNFQAEHLPQRSPQFFRLDLRLFPFNLGEPLDSVQDGAEDICSLAIWKI